MEILLRPPTDIKNLLAFYFFKIAKKKCKDDLVSKAFNEYNNVKNDYKLDCPDFCDAETFGKWSKEEIKKKILEKLYQ